MTIYDNGNPVIYKKWENIAGVQPGLDTDKVINVL